MPEHCTGVMSNIKPARQPLPSLAPVRHIVVLVLCILVVVASLLLRHRGDGLSLFGIEWPVSCALYRNIGVKCALCGLTRSFSSVARGQFSEAMQFHPLGLAVFVSVCLQIAYRIHMLWIAGTESRTLRLAGIYLAVALAGALLINWFVYIGGLVL